MVDSVKCLARIQKSEDTTIKNTISVDNLFKYTLINAVVSFKSKLVRTSIKINRDPIIDHDFSNFADHTGNILTDSQHGFRAKRSTDTQLIQTFHDIFKSLDKKETVDMAILDFTKAFDKVPHKRLIHKLNYYGISGSIATWVETFLIGMTQQVVVNWATSSSTIVTSGVPQGTVLGPLLFLLYINDLPDNLSTRVRLFADDCILYTPIRTQNDSSLLQNDLLKWQKWQDKWLMKFNPGKCYTMPLATRTPSPNMYTFCEQTLTSVDSHCYIGIAPIKYTELDSSDQSSQYYIKRNLNKCPTHIKASRNIYIVGSSSSSDCCAGQRSTPHSRTLEVRPGRITKKLGLRYDCDCERDETKSLLGVLMLGCDILIANDE